MRYIQALGHLEGIATPVCGLVRNDTFCFGDSDKYKKPRCNSHRGLCASEEADLAGIG